MGRRKLIYDVWENDKCVLTGEIEAICGFLGKSPDYIRAATSDARRINKKYTVTLQHNPGKGEGTARYILWDDSQIVGVFKIAEIARNCFGTQTVVRNAAKTGDYFAGNYKTMSYSKFAQEWEMACGNLRRSAAGSGH